MYKPDLLSGSRSPGESSIKGFQEWGRGTNREQELLDPRARKWFQAAMSLWLSSVKRETQSLPAELLQDPMRLQYVKATSSEHGKHRFIHSTNINLASALGQALFQALGMMYRQCHVNAIKTSKAGNGAVAVGGMAILNRDQRKFHREGHISVKT